MMYSVSIPHIIDPVYTLSNTQNVNLEVGSAVKDLPQGGETVMKINYDATVINSHSSFNSEIIRLEKLFNEKTSQYDKDFSLEKIRLEKDFNAATTQYDKDFNAATIKSARAEKILQGERMKRMIATVILVACIIGVVGVTIAAVLTQTWPILFAVAPLLIGVVISGIYATRLIDKVYRLEDDIEAPSKIKKPSLLTPSLYKPDPSMYKPRLYLPSPYTPELDLDLLETRVNLQNTLAPMTIAQLAKSGHSDKKIINYALLDKVDLISPNNRPAFYGKAIQLIHDYREMKAKHDDYVKEVNAKLNRLNKKFEDWKSKKEYDLLSQGTNLSLEEYDLLKKEKSLLWIYSLHRRHYSPVIAVVNGIMSRLDIARQKVSIAENKAEFAQNQISFVREHDKIKAKITSWHTSSKNAINTGYKNVVTSIENHFNQAKTAAA